MSRLSVERCAAHIRTLLGASGGGDDDSGLPEGLSVIELVNDAGNFLVNQREWKWLQGSVVSVGFTASQNYVDLPSDFKSIVAIDTAGLTSDFEMVSLGRIIKLKKNTQGSTLYYEASIEQDYSGVGPPQPRLAVWPTPTTTDASALNLYYRRGWQEVVSDNALLVLPEFLEGAFLECLRACAAGWSEPEGGSRASRLMEVVQGPDWRGAAKRDAGMQPDYGVLTNGMAQGSQWTGDWRDVSVPGPT